MARVICWYQAGTLGHRPIPPQQSPCPRVPRHPSVDHGQHPALVDHPVVLIDSVADDLHQDQLIRPVGIKRRQPVYRTSRDAARPRSRRIGRPASHRHRDPRPWPRAGCTAGASRRRLGLARHGARPRSGGRGAAGLPAEGHGVQPGQGG